MDVFTPNPAISAVLVPVVAFLNVFLNRILRKKGKPELEDIDKVAITLSFGVVLTFLSSAPVAPSEFYPVVTQVLSGIATGLYAGGIYVGGAKITNAVKDARRP